MQWGVDDVNTRSMLRNAQASNDFCKATVKVKPKQPQGAKV